MEENNVPRPESVSTANELHDNKNYKKKAIEASAFVIFGFGLSQIIRLAGNLVLTRLLAPELFGIIAIARVFVMGIGLFSDIGLEPAVVRSKRAYEPAFINTAWTIQVLRSVILALFSIAAAFPVASVYGEPVLKLIIPIIGLNCIPRGFQATSLVLMDKELLQKKLTYMELIIQSVSLVCMIAVAYFYRTIWALLVGEFIATLIRTVWSHLINTDSPNKFFWEKKAINELLSFGKWILISTAMMFLATQADRLLLGKLFVMSFFGVYSIAVNLAELPKQVINRLSQKVIFPLISKFSHLPRNELRLKIKMSRRKLIFLLGALVAILGCFGDFIVLVLYDQRYSAGAWILPLLVFGMWPLILTTTIDGSLLSIGKPKYAAMGNFIKFIYMVIAVPLLFKVGGKFGAVLAVALNDIPGYIIINYGLYKEKLSLLKQDAFMTLVLIGITGILLLVRIITGLGLPGQLLF